MNVLRPRSLLVASSCFALQLLTAHAAFASIANGMPALDVIGQYDQTTFGGPLLPIFTKSTANNGPGRLGFNFTSTMGLAIDTVHHRLFVGDSSNNRVAVFSLNNDNTLTNKVITNVLGQPDFNTVTLGLTQTGLRGPSGVSYDSVNDRLFVADSSNHRVIVYNTASITNGMNAANVLGQANFTSGGAATTQTGLNLPQDVQYDSANQRLFVADRFNSRVLVYDLSGGITDGMNAFRVLGNSIFTTNGQNLTQTAMFEPFSLSYDPPRQRLFVADYRNVRTLEFDLAGGIVNGMNATHVLGQPGFTTQGAATTQVGVQAPQGVSFDSVTQYLFVSDNLSNRVLVYDISATTTNGQNAAYVIGQANFTTNTATLTQSGLASPRGMVLDPTNRRMYLGDNTNHRVTVLDLSATTTTNMSAIDELGQYDANSTDPFSTTVIYTKGGANNGPNRIGINSQSFAGTFSIDGVNHRMFFADRSNSRILVFNLNTDDTFQDKIADFVIGQPDFNTNTAVTTQAGTGLTRAVLYDSTTQRLFFSDGTGNRVLVFNLSGGIVNGMSASFVIGQANFTSAGTATTQTGMSAPSGLAVAASGQRLFVNDTANNRVLVFDFSNGISNGMNAAYAIGQVDFTSAVVATTQTSIKSPQGILYDADGQRLFVGDVLNSRVMQFDLSATTTTNMNAAHVLGQINFTSVSAVATQTGMNGTRDMAYDSVNHRLFVSDSTNRRVLVFDISNGIVDGMNASYVIGQANFTSAVSAVTQTGFAQPTGMYYNPINQNLVVSDISANRVMIFDVTPPTGGAAHCPSYHLALTRPIGGESFKAGATENVLWTLDGCQTVKMTASLTTDGGLTYTPISDITNFSSGAYAWHVPDVTTANARINLTAFGPGNTVLATATSPIFKITGSSTNSPMNPDTSATGTPQVPPPTPPPAGTGCTQDTLIKASTPAVYWCGFDLKRHVFPNEAIFFSWYHDFKGVITMSDSQLASVPLGRNVTFHPGVLLKLQTDPKVYVVGDKEGLLHPIPDEATAKRLYGPKWNTLIHDLSEAFFTDYHVGEPAG